MAFMPGEIIRLLRETWPNATMLAEELYAIFNTDKPIELTSPLQITNPRPGVPSLTIADGGFSDSVLINKSGLPGFSFPPLPGLPPYPAANPAGGFSVTITIGPGGVAASQGPTGGAQSPVPRPQSGGGGFPGKVVSGTGDTYEVDVYADGLASPPVRRTVTQLQIAPDETIPAGTWALVAQSGGGFVMQVPVWL